MRIDERHTSELLGQSTRTMVLPSGLTVQMCRMPGFVTAYAMLTVGVGSIDIGYRVRGREVSLPAGVSHYLEHKMFDCPYGDAMQRFDALGASANAFTSFDKTAYYFSCTENFSKALEVLLDFVATLPSAGKEGSLPRSCACTATAPSGWSRRTFCRPCTMFIPSGRILPGRRNPSPT